MVISPARPVTLRRAGAVHKNEFYLVPSIVLGHAGTKTSVLCRFITVGYTPLVSGKGTLDNANTNGRYHRSRTAALAG